MAKKEAIQAIEKSFDAVEETAQTLERIPKVNLNGTTKKQQVIILSTVAVVSGVVGAGLAVAKLKGKLRLRRKSKPVPFVQNVYSSDSK